ncbi:SDR family NAD(P)-dependent oxidoreductase [Alteromonas halophila]|uniref:Short chain dehydrogenase n=1 Tax=Alteromonas halophila TaxID=516698 RepID=A0A918JPJ2_9ALTE|nr:SDR family NAD(P)-dependent oxidoreductase [Alteromonas halophila]GGW94087.1 short chain dehydrogenase [Alteromonas halophila]
MTGQGNKDKPTALITGAASGLGLEIARQLAENYHLLLLDLDIRLLRKQTGDVGDVTYLQCDLSNPVDITRLISEVKDMMLPIDVLINNAGITHRSLATNTQTDVIRKVMDVDFLGPVQLTQGLLPQLSEQASIVNIGSMAGWMPVLGRAGYCAAKSALHQYFETLRAELAGSDIHILMVYPSFLDTPIDKNALDGRGGNATGTRSMVGRMRSSHWMASRVISALNARKARVFPDRFTFLSSLLYRLFPALYLHLMRKRLSPEFKVRQDR